MSEEMRAAETDPAPLGAVRLVGLWTLATAAGEGAGLLVSALVGATLASPATLAGGPWVGEAFLLLTGMIEGACLGATQEPVLRRIYPSLRRGRWTLATSVGMGAGWLVATHLDDPFAVDVAADSAPMVIALGAGLGIGLGATLGVAQALVLSRVRRPRSWVIATALAWVLGMIVSGLGNAQIPAGEWTVGLFALVFASGAASGTVVGLVTSIAHLGDR